MARRYQDLDAWRLANELKRAVYALTSSGPAARDLRFCSQIRDSAASAPRNIAEGFGRFRPASFAHFLEIAIGSIMETRCTLQDGVDRGHFAPASVADLDALAERSLQVCTRLLLYLKRRHQELG